MVSKQCKRSAAVAQRRKFRVLRLCLRLTEMEIVHKEVKGGTKRPCCTLVVFRAASNEGFLAARKLVWRETGPQAFFEMPMYWQWAPMW